MNIVCLTWADYECQENYYFDAPEGTTEQDFRKLCDSLLKEAAEEAIRLKGYTLPGIVPLEDDKPTWVGWMNLVQVLADKILPKHGYQPVKFPAAIYSGSTIIRDKSFDDPDGILKDAFDIINQHNESVHEWLNTRLQEQRELFAAQNATLGTSPSSSENQS